MVAHVNFTLSLKYPESQRNKTLTKLDSIFETGSVSRWKSFSLQNYQNEGVV